MAWHTWNNVPSIHCIFILNETKAIHQFDLCDLAGAMGAEIVFDILFSNWREPNARKAPWETSALGGPTCGPGKERKKAKTAPKSMAGYLVSSPTMVLSSQLVQSRKKRKKRVFCHP